MGLVTGDRIVMILPTTLEGIYVIEACKRLGIIYACVPSSLPAQSLADRVEDTRPGAVPILTHNIDHDDALLMLA